VFYFIGIIRALLIWRI